MAIDIRVQNVFEKNNLKINFFKNTLLLRISIKFFQNLKKELNSVGTSPMDWFYKEESKREAEGLSPLNRTSSFQIYSAKC